MARPQMLRRGASTRRKVGALGLAVVGLTCLSFASAAQLNVDASALAAGSAQVGDCQGTAEFRVQLVTTWETAENPDAFATTGVIVHQVESACIGQTLMVTLVDSNGTALRAASLAPIAVAGTQPTITFATRVLTSTVDHAEVVIHS